MESAKRRTATNDSYSGTAVGATYYALGDSLQLTLKEANANRNRTSFERSTAAFFRRSLGDYLYNGGAVLDRYIMVMLGGASGSLARYVFGAAIMARLGTRFPVGTLVINVTGSFLIGLLMALFTERLQPYPNLRLLLVVGFLGGYTTFSSFEWETLTLVKDGGRWLGLLNIVGSVAFGYIAVWLGSTIVGKR